MTLLSARADAATADLRSLVWDAGVQSFSCEQTETTQPTQPSIFRGRAVDVLTTVFDWKFSTL